MELGYAFNLRLGLEIWWYAVVLNQRAHALSDRRRELDWDVHSPMTAGT